MTSGVMLDHFIATKCYTAHKVNSYYTLAISYCTFCVEKHTILGPGQTGEKNKAQLTWPAIAIFRLHLVETQDNKLSQGFFYT